MWTNILKPSRKCYLGKVLRYLVFKKVRASSTKIFVGSCLIAAMSSYLHKNISLHVNIFSYMALGAHCSESCFTVLVVLTEAPSVLSLDLALKKAVDTWRISQEQIN